ncbi:hypothetical protein ADK70_12550 [Streptomyces rimosus subsp. pseudoverticillatus]|uniref:hypothetical protein n=1 Tax=Streptomyces rimosus TaxID=1927 RepID=UPI0006B2A7C7|nr:hypothetical protein [Streptomyces rimosus]KOT94501.1 hypothetical protein ADK70_12550 [Streptomyces rimosus subsp. pseudoverticillatus]
MTTTETLIDRARGLYEQRFPDGNLWWGTDGQPITGAQVVAHAEAAAERAATTDWKASGCPGEVADGRVHTTYYAVGAIIEILIRTATGAPYADAWAWYLQPDLTADEARAMYKDVAAFARRYGPEAA